MSKNINYYPGATLANEELRFKDYSEKYLSLFVDLIRSGTEDVLFVKNSDDFEMSKGSGSPEQLIINEGFALFIGINDSLTDFEFSNTLNVNEFPDQRFFVKSTQKTVTIPAGTASEVRHVYLQNFLNPAGFRCSVTSDGVVTIADGGVIKKSEVPALLRGSNSKAPTRVRFLKTDYTEAVNQSVYEVNSFTDDVVVLNGNISNEVGEVICIPIGSFDLGVDNNLQNRALFGVTETKVIIDSDDTLDSGIGIVKVGHIEFTSTTEYTIHDEREDNKYIISIDLDIDLSDFVTKSTNQVITGEKHFRSFGQGRIATLNYTNNFLLGGFFNYIDIAGASHANDFIFDLQNQNNVSIDGFGHSGKALGTDPLTELVPGASIKVSFKNVGSNCVFRSTYMGLPQSITVRPGVLYTIRFDHQDSTIPVYSISHSASIYDIISLENSKKNKSDYSVTNNFHSSSDFVISYMTNPLGGGLIEVTVFASIRRNRTGLVTTTSLPEEIRPQRECVIDYWANPVTPGDSPIANVSIVINTNGIINCRNNTSVTRNISLKYLIGMNSALSSA